MQPAVSFCSQRSDAVFDHEWTFDELFSLFKFLDEWKLEGIALGGGEPFTFPRLAELVRKTWNETGLDVSITSNGLLITRRRPPHSGRKRGRNQSQLLDVAEI